MHSKTLPPKMLGTDAHHIWPQASHLTRHLPWNNFHHVTNCFLACTSQIQNTKCKIQKLKALFLVVISCEITNTLEISGAFCVYVSVCVCAHAHVSVLLCVGAHTKPARAYPVSSKADIRVFLYCLLLYHWSRVSQLNQSLPYSLVSLARPHLCLSRDAHLGFKWVQRIYTLALMLRQQALYPPNHYPSPRKKVC